MVGGTSGSETKVDLFASQPASSSISPPVHLFASQPASFSVSPPVDLFATPPANSAISPAVDFFAAPERMEPEIKPLESKMTSTQAVDPFAAVPLNGFDNSDFFGSFSSHTGSESTYPSQSFTDSSNLNDQNYKTPVASAHPSKDGFQVKSGVWADSLSRGLIDLNITGHNQEGRPD